MSLKQDGMMKDGTKVCELIEFLQDYVELNGDQPLGLEVWDVYGVVEDARLRLVPYKDQLLIEISESGDEE